VHVFNRRFDTHRKQWRERRKVVEQRFFGQTISREFCSQTERLAACFAYA
jgi:hypothetical protein